VEANFRAEVNLPLQVGGWGISGIEEAHAKGQDSGFKEVHISDSESGVVSRCEKRYTLSGEWPYVQESSMKRFHEDQDFGNGNLEQHCLEEELLRIWLLRKRSGRSTSLSKGCL